MSNTTITPLQMALDADIISVGQGGIYQGSYIGKLADGKAIILGIVGDEDNLNAWLIQYPTAEHWEQENIYPGAPTEFQIIMAKTYAVGEYEHLLSVEYSHLWDEMRVEDVGDTSFLALWRDLSTREDCTDMDTAIKRMETDIRETQGVLDALRKAQVES